MGGAQPLAVTMNEGAVLAVEVDPARAERRHAVGYVDEVTTDLDEAVRRVDAWRAAGDQPSRDACLVLVRRVLARADFWGQDLTAALPGFGRDARQTMCVQSASNTAPPS